MKKISIPYYIKVLIFYITLSIIYISVMTAAGRSEKVIYWAIGMIMTGGGIYVISFTYGAYLQYKSKLNFLKIFLLAIVVFFIGLVEFYFTWLPNTLSISDLHTRYYLMQSVYQSLSFFIGSILMKLTNS